jgi:putative transposase
MSRIARVILPGVWHHITQRGNRRQTVFFDDSDRELYLQLLERHCSKHGVKITGYCLMTNHVHLLAIPARETSLARAFGGAHTDYARWLNLHRGETGHFWQSRYFSCPLDEDHRWEALRYVELNPVRAGIAATAEEWRWSSAAAHLGGADWYGRLDLTDWHARWSAESWHEALEEDLTSAAILERIREATRTGRPAGSDAFIMEAEKQSGRRLHTVKRGPKPKLTDSSNQLELEI